MRIPINIFHINFHLLLQVEIFFIYIISLLSGENSPKQLLLINNQLVTKLIKFFD